MNSAKSSARTPTHLVDTSFLLCFGALPKTTDLLRELFDGGLAAPQAVRNELDSLPDNSKKSEHVRASSRVFVGKTAGLLLQADLFEGDVAERDLAMTCLAKKQVPPRHSGLLPEPGEKIDGVTSGENSGEAEAIAAAFRRKLPLLITDGPATKYAKQRGLTVESAARSIGRLARTPKQKYQMYLEIERTVGNAGEVVTGWLWYRD